MNTWHLERLWYTERTTTGKLWRPSGPIGARWTFMGYVLEDRVRAPGVKVPKRTAIPSGTYEVIITHSLRFRRPLPLLLDVPMYAGIRIHPGNDELDTDGCLLPGLERGIDRVLRSRDAFDAVLLALEQDLARGPTRLQIVNVAPPSYLVAPSAS